MKDKKLKLEDVKAPQTGWIIILLYINSAKGVVSHWEVELCKPRSICLAADSARGWVWLR